MSDSASTAAPAAIPDSRTDLGIELISPVQLVRQQATEWMQQGNLRAAVHCLEQALRINPLDVASWVLMSEILFQAGEVTASLDCLRQALQLAPGDRQARLLLANIQKQLGELDAAIGNYRQILAEDPGHVVAAVNLASSLRAQGKTAEALPWLKQVIKPEGTSPLIHFNYANALVDVGEFAEARQHYQMALRTHPQPAKVFFNLTAITRFTPDEQSLLQEMESLILSQLKTVDDQIHYHFGMGKALDDLRAYDRAFQHFEQGNSQVTVQFDPEAQREELARWRDCWSESFIQNRQHWSDDTFAPIFIVGMPRSGTTLVEQLLSQLPGVQALGERTRMGNLIEEYSASLGCRHNEVQAVERLTQVDLLKIAQDYQADLPPVPGIHHITDKLPGNFMWLGWIALCFPRAIIVNCRRDPRDVCLSCYFQHFTARIPYSYNLSHLVEQYRNYEQLMAHWHQVLPGRIFDVCYEELVEDPERHMQPIQALLDPPADSPMNVAAAGQRIIQTASAWQARQPVYRHARQRWRNYRQHIGPLLAAFGEKLEPTCHHPISQ